MNSFVSVLYAENLFVCALSNALNLKYYFLCGRLSITERWRVVGFCPHATSAEVFGINLRALVPIVGSFEGGAQHNEPGTPRRDTTLLGAHTGFHGDGLGHGLVALRTSAFPPKTLHPKDRAAASRNKT